MADPSERIYELARDALAEQERQVEELRRRAPAVLATGALVATLLAKPVFRGNHPDGTGEWIGAGLGSLGIAVILIGSVLVMLSYDLAFTVSADQAYDELWRSSAIEAPASDIALAEAFVQRGRRNERVVRRLHACFELVLAGLVCEAAGLTTAAALAS